MIIEVEFDNGDSCEIAEQNMFSAIRSLKESNTSEGEDFVRIKSRSGYFAYSAVPDIPGWVAIEYVSRNWFESKPVSLLICDPETL